jgi:hypothetical protein
MAELNFSVLANFRKACNLQSQRRGLPERALKKIKLFKMLCLIDAETNDSKQNNIRLDVVIDTKMASQY